MRQQPRDPIRSPRGPEELRRVGRSTVLATGTLACPECDAPVAPGTRPLTPSDALACPYCGCRGAVRDFLSLAAPARPARVVVHVRAQS
jgi:hypothetical protein